MKLKLRRLNHAAKCWEISDDSQSIGYLWQTLGQYRWSLRSPFVVDSFPSGVVGIQQMAEYVYQQHLDGSYTTYKREFSQKSLGYSTELVANSYV